MTDDEVATAYQVWSDYQKNNDLSEQKGLAVGIDPDSGRVWFGDSAAEIIQNREAEGISSPLLFLRVGYDYYLRKGYHP